MIMNYRRFGTTELIKMWYVCRSYGEISMSLCGGLTSQDGNIVKPSEDRFLHSLITYNDLVQNPKMVENPDLVVRLDGEYYNWRTVCPLIMSLVVYQKPLPQVGDARFSGENQAA